MEINTERISWYFKGLTDVQVDQFRQLADLYAFWNAQINLISRKDIAELYERHILHSLGIAKVCSFLKGEDILDVGTGGGFPGIPLAILFPDTQFYLIDSIGKKIKVVNEVAAALGLKNVQTAQKRAEKIDHKFNFVVSRAVARLAEFYPWIQHKFKKENQNRLPNGLLYLKGGDLTTELAEMNRTAELFPLSTHFQENFFETKYVVYIKA